MQIEVDDLDQLDDALTAGARHVLLDNFTVDNCREAIRRIRALGRDVVVEASGGLTLDRALVMAKRASTTSPSERSPTLRPRSTSASMSNTRVISPVDNQPDC